MSIQSIITCLDMYFSLFPEEEQKLENFTAFVAHTSVIQDFFDRKNMNGHVVANACVVNSQGEILTIFHNFLKMNIVPGGHVDDTDHSILEAAMRELKEETGLGDVIIHSRHTNNNNVPLFIESHLIPKNDKKNEGEHWHHDFMYVFSATTNTITLQKEEVNAFNRTNKAILLKDSQSFLGKTLLKAQKLSIL